MSRDQDWTSSRRAVTLDLDLRRGEPLAGISAETVENVLTAHGWRVAIVERGWARHIDLLAPRDESVPTDLARTLAAVRRLARQHNRQHQAGSPECFDEAGRHRASGCGWTVRSKRSQVVSTSLDKMQRRAAAALERFVVAATVRGPVG